MNRGKGSDFSRCKTWLEAVSKSDDENSPALILFSMSSVTAPEILTGVLLSEPINLLLMYNAFFFSSSSGNCLKSLTASRN